MCHRKFYNDNGHADGDGDDGVGMVIVKSE